MLSRAMGVAFLPTIYKDPTLPHGMRMDAAAKAAPFERPMLASTDVRLIRRIEDLTEEELMALTGEEASIGRDAYIGEPRRQFWAFIEVGGYKTGCSDRLAVHEKDEELRGTEPRNRRADGGTSLLNRAVAVPPLMPEPFGDDGREVGPVCDGNNFTSWHC
jgi:hypothetical protein